MAGATSQPNLLDALIQRTAKRETNPKGRRTPVPEKAGMAGK
jgi:hypothetical protein